MKRVIVSLCLAVLLLPTPCRAGQVTDREVNAALVAFLQAEGPAGMELLQWDLRRGDPLPLAGRIVAVERLPGRSWKEKTPLRVRVKTPAGTEQVLYVHAHLRYARTVLVARRNLTIGETIGPEDLSVEVREGWRTTDDLYHALDQVVGKSIWRPVSQGACLKRWHVSERRDLDHGDDVLIVAQQAGIRVEAPGKVMERGSPGDRIRVLNVTSGKEVSATVLDMHTVSVSF